MRPWVHGKVIRSIEVPLSIILEVIGVVEFVVSLVGIYKELLFFLANTLMPSLCGNGALGVPILIVVHSVIAIVLRLSLDLNINFLGAFWLLDQSLHWAATLHSLLWLLAVRLDSFELVNKDSLLLHIGLVELRMLLVLHFSKHCIAHSIALLLGLPCCISRIEGQRLRHTQVT